MRPTISTKPHWPIPSTKRQELATPGPRMLKHFTERHQGLREIRIYVSKTRVADVSVTGSEIQRLFLERDKDAPLESPTSLCRITWLRGERFVRTHKARSQFRIHLIGAESNGDAFDQQCRFTIGLHDLSKDDPAMDDDGDGTDDDIEDEEDEEDEDGKEEDEDEEEDDWNDDERDTPSAMVPMVERIEPITGQRQLVPQQINPAFITHIQQSTLELAHRAYTGPMRENRGLVHEMRTEMTKMIQTVQSLAESLLTKQQSYTEMLLTKQFEMADRYARRDQETIDHLAERLQTMEQMQLNHMQLDGKRYENFQELAKQGWQAFLDAMDMKQSVTNERLELADWIRRHNEQTTPPAPPQASALPGLFAQGIPVVLGGLSLLVRRSGDNQSADFLANMAMRYAPAQGEEEEEHDDVIDADVTQPHQEGFRQDHDPAPFVGHEDGSIHRPPTPFADRARAFRAGLTADKLSAIRKLLPVPAWRALNTACAATVDRVAIDALRSLEGFIRKDPTLQLGLAATLSESEVATILEMIEAVAQASTTRPPRRPPPSS